MPPAVGRRHLLGISIPAAGGIALSACGQLATQAQPSPAWPTLGRGRARSLHPRDSTREHGVLKRVLLIYREGIRRLQAGEQDPAHALNTGAGIIRTFIEDYHEHLEEQVRLPRSSNGQANSPTSPPCCAPSTSAAALLTDRVLAATTGAAALDQPARQALVQDMSAFIRMYEPHEAREDTVIFPALREVVPANEFRELAETFEDEEHRRFGQAGFQGVVDKVADIEKSLGIYDLSQFTPALQAVAEGSSRTAEAAGVHCGTRPRPTVGRRGCRRGCRRCCARPGCR